MITFNPDKFGFYHIGNYKTYSKKEAIEKSIDTGQEYFWNFNDDMYSKIDWSIEPDISLWELYKARARQIRDAYDYVVIFYSGGSDCHNLLLAWIDAGCKIDEIATSWNYEASKDKNDHFNAEITNVVLPDIQKLKDSGIEFKFRHIDISQYCLDSFTEWGLDYEYNVNFHVSPNSPARHMFREKIQDYKDVISSGKKMAFVWGKEKPILQNNKIIFIDNIDGCVGPYIQRNYHNGWYDELFYWTPDFPEIVVKQYHVILNFLQHSDEKNKDMFTIEPNSNGYSKNLNMYISNETLKTLIYPKWSNDIFCNGKSHSFIISERDRWFFESNLELKKRFYGMIHSYTNHLDIFTKKGIISGSRKGGLIPKQTRSYGF